MIFIEIAFSPFPYFNPPHLHLVSTCQSRQKCRIEPCFNGRVTGIWALVPGIPPASPFLSKVPGSVRQLEASQSSLLSSTTNHQSSIDLPTASRGLYAFPVVQIHGLVIKDIDNHRHRQVQGVASLRGQRSGCRECGRANIGVSLSRERGEYVQHYTQSALLQLSFCATDVNSS